MVALYGSLDTSRPEISSCLWMKNTIHTKHISRHGEFNPVMIVAMLFVKRTSFPTTTCSSLLSWMAFVQALATFVYPHWSSLFSPAVEFACDSSLTAPLVQAGDVLDKSSAGDSIFVCPRSSLFIPAVECAISLCFNALLQMFSGVRISLMLSQCSSGDVYSIALWRSTWGATALVFSSSGKQTSPSRS